MKAILSVNYAECKTSACFFREGNVFIVVTPIRRDFHKKLHKVLSYFYFALIVLEK